MLEVSQLQEKDSVKSIHLSFCVFERWDNSVMERFWGSLKSECTDGKIYYTREAAVADVIEYIEMFYNSKRLHSTLGYMSPMQFENEFLLRNVATFT